MQSDEKASLGRAMFRGLIWLFFQSASGRVISILTQVALARLLLPAQFGVIGLVYIVTGIASTLTAFGVDAVLLQRHKAIRLWITSSFWTSLGLGVFGFVVVACLAPAFAYFYHSPQITGLALILAASMPIGALSTVPSVLMTSELNFRFPAIYMTVETLAGQIATLLLAWAGFGAFSFVLPTPVLGLIRAGIYWWRAPVRVTRRARRSQVRYLLTNGLSVFGARLVTEVIGQGDYAVLGLVATHSEVGLYFFAFRLSVQSLWIIGGNFTGVLVPALVRVKDDAARQIAGALRAAELLSYVVMPACFLQAAVADPGLRLFFGQKWVDSIPLAQLLSIGLAFDAVAWIGGGLLAARRAFRRGFLYNLTALPFFLALVGTGAVVARAPGVAAAVMIYYMLFGPIYSTAVFTRYGARAADVLSLYAKPPLLAAGAMGIAYLISFSPGIASSQLLRLIEILLIGPPLYLGLLRATKPDVLREILERLSLLRILGKVRRTSQEALAALGGRAGRSE